tara:strand:- start:279 stop:470 length:192 start_codon:yes stop_codon:yes gene_type:complete
MLNTFVSILLAIPITVIPYSYVEDINMRDLCEELYDTLEQAVTDDLITEKTAQKIYQRCLQSI